MHATSVWCNSIEDILPAHHVGSFRAPCEHQELRRLRQDRPDYLSGHVGQAVAPAVVEVGQPLVVDAQQVQHRGVQVVDGDAIDGGLVADLVRLAVARRRP